MIGKSAFIINKCTQFLHISTSLQYSMYFSLQLHEEDDALNMWMFDAVENNGKYTRYVPQKWSYYAAGSSGSDHVHVLL